MKQTFSTINIIVKNLISMMGFCVLTYIWTTSNGVLYHGDECEGCGDECECEGCHCGE